MNASRIFYIDALKAFAIVLVVMGHTNVIWEVGGSNSMYLPILSVFHMPLFMALSGYVTNVESFNLAKRAKMLIPFFVFGFAWTAFVQLPIGEFFTSEAKKWLLVSICVVRVFRLPVIDKGYEAKSLYRHGTCANRTDGIAFHVPSNYYRNNN